MPLTEHMLEALVLCPGHILRDTTRHITFQHRHHPLPESTTQQEAYETGYYGRYVVHHATRWLFLGSTAQTAYAHTETLSCLCPSLGVS